VAIRRNRRSGGAGRRGGAGDTRRTGRGGRKSNSGVGWFRVGYRVVT
jgi:hypothetical protein